MFCKFFAMVIACGLVLQLQSNFNLVSAAVTSYSSQEFPGDDLLEGKVKGDEVRKSYSEGLGHRGRSLYMDPAFIPYIHPRFVYEEDIPQEFMPPSTKRATKGMLVDVVDFVTKGSAGRNQRLGQDMRSSGRR